MKARHQRPLERKMKGRGLGTKEYSSGFRGTSAVAILREDGTLGIISAATDIGQGCNTTLMMIAAEEFGCSLERVSIVADGDTDTTPYDFSSIGSRITHSLGRAVQDAARQVREQTLEVAERIMREMGIIQAGAQLEVEDERVQVKGDPKRERFLWGVRILPWLILTDEDHLVRAEGFPLRDLHKKLAVQKEPPGK